MRGAVLRTWGGLTDVNHRCSSVVTRYYPLLSFYRWRNWGILAHNNLAKSCTVNRQKHLGYDPRLISYGAQVLQLYANLSYCTQQLNRYKYLIQKEMVRGLGECIGGPNLVWRVKEASLWRRREGGWEVGGDENSDKEGERLPQQGQNRDEDLGLVESSVSY